ncbi:hypothetical protein ACFW91_24845 [Streptomyces asoensis]|uniref:hypothetical protein n=1 Tax=Streptomyces asoensis TaxID=249586 RepID=UPI0036AF01E7
MGVRDRATPPTEWCNWWTEVHGLTPDIAYGWVPPELTAAPDDPNPWFWHWCPQAANGEGRWMAQAAPDHTLVASEPLHMEPSLLWPCCGTHGFVRGGEWIPA